ncbi:MAG TPA: hypothetical protein VKY27_12355 [Bacteriovoracaceae bacterium]|nr:hypothetical protein [Bacteriovoracaceae bacterium]
MSIESKILISRFLTRSGDQAWDFAIPIVLITLFPEQLRISFIYFFALKVSTVFLMPYLGKFIDRLNRLTCMKLGIGMQVLGALFSAILIFIFQTSGKTSFELTSTFIAGYILLILFGCVSSLGSQLMDIAVSSDLVPSVVPPTRLAHVNSNLRKLDLATEVGSPIIAGALLLISLEGLPSLGFYLILLWNLISFYPEYYLLKEVISSREELNIKPQENVISQGVLEQLKTGYKHFVQEPIAPVILITSLIWVSVLSPHGLLLTAFLKSGWDLSEPVIGVFRGLGALFGLSATFIYPVIHVKKGALQTGKFFISTQSIMLILSLIFFIIEDGWARYLFMTFLLLSRIGLYGFSLAETQLRQVHIPINVRGRLNGLSTSLNHLMTLIIYGLGIIFSETNEFVYLVFISVVAVSLAALLFNRLKSL